MFFSSEQNLFEQNAAKQGELLEDCAEMQKFVSGTSLIPNKMAMNFVYIV
jgi:hypothetical protein